MKPLENDRQGEAEHYYYNTEDTAGAGRPSDRDSPSKDDKPPPQPNGGDKNHKVTKLPQMVDKPSPKKEREREIQRVRRVTEEAPNPRIHKKMNSRMKKSTRLFLRILKEKIRTGAMEIKTRLMLVPLVPKHKTA